MVPMAEKIARVLLVEDDEDDYILTCDYLNQLDSHTFKIDWVTNPTTALEQLNLGMHDICLLDYQLGAYNGLTVLEKAATNGCTIPIIMLTGQSDDTLDQLALAAGAVDYLAKGEITTSRFARAIRYALARQEIEKERIERINAETQNQSKDRFLAHLSHELRTPLTSILGYTEILLNSNKAPNAASELNIILNNGQHLLGLLNNVLDLSKIAVGKLEYNFSTIKLDSFIADIFSLMKVHAAEKSLELVISAPEPLPKTITSDPVRLRQVLINLIHNGIKFTKQGQVELRLTTDMLEGQEQLRFTISDTGQGIPDNMLATIFKPFEQVEDAVSRKEQGAGLGLSICAELIKQMGGTINVKSVLNQGSDFTFSLDPGDITTQERDILAIDQEQSTNEQLVLPPLQGHVLVVDDMADIRQLIGQICKSFGLTVSYAGNGLQALEQVKLASVQGTSFDLVLMDIHMPELDGKRTIKALKSLAFNKPIIAITAATMKGVKQELITLGFNHIIAKPIDKKKLYSALNHYLDLKSERTINESGSSISSCEQTLAQPTKPSILVVEDADANGLDLAGTIKQSHPEIALVLVSGATVSEKDLKQVGIDKAILKPVNLAILKNLL